jgi:glutathione-dependent peroxiredoxin
MRNPIHKKVGDLVPDALFPIRQGDDWHTLTTADVFKGRKVVLFSLPGAFTPTCSKSHLPGFSSHAAQLIEAGVNKICCLSVNDWFTMEAWRKDLKIGEEVMMLPDGNADFTTAMGMLVDKRHLGFGTRSWRYSMMVNDCIIEKLFVEDFSDEGDPFQVSGAPLMLEALQK